LRLRAVASLRLPAVATLRLRAVAALRLPAVSTLRLPAVAALRLRVLAALRRAVSARRRAARGGAHVEAARGVLLHRQRHALRLGGTAIVIDGRAVLVGVARVDRQLPAVHGFLTWYAAPTARASSRIGRCSKRSRPVRLSVACPPRG
jgi:hypothetical protein